MSVLEVLIIVIFFHTAVTLFVGLTLREVREQLGNLDYDMVQLNVWLQSQRGKFTTE